MYWTIKVDKTNDDPRDLPSPVGRFVIHEHRDEYGDHLDLRLEQEGFLSGWRIAGDELCDDAWATLKLPHPLHWLEEDRDAVRRDEGTYAWERHGAQEQALILYGREGVQRVTLRVNSAITPAVARAVEAAASECGIEPSAAAQLMRDGATARTRAVERLCGLGKELDGGAFDEGVWRKTLASLAVDEIHSQLRSFEIRFDCKHPPQPVSKPEELVEEGCHERTESALSIVRE